MSTLKQNVTFPIGRMVWGSVVDAQVKDAEGKPLVIKTGPDAGKPTQRYAFGVAFKKGPETHWSSTEWGKVIWAIGHAAFPGGQAQSPTFSFKVKDGDGTIPNKNGKKPVDQGGHAGHWVVSFSSSFAPKVCNADGTNKMYDAKAIKCGHFVQVLGTVDGNGSTSQPGVYVNHDWVAHSGYGPEIFTGSDPSAAGFGGGAAPAGMSTIPVGGMAAPAALPPPAAVALPAAAPLPTPAPLPPTAVAPNPSILGAAPPPPAAAVVAPPPAAPQMTAKATATYDQYRGGGWTDEQLRAHGFIV